MPLILLILICGAVAWFFSDKLEWFSAESDESVPRMTEVAENRSSGASPADPVQSAIRTRSFDVLPDHPGLNAPIREHVDYAVESIGYWCRQLDAKLGSASTSEMKDLVAEVTVSIQEHGSTLDLCYAKIIASTAGLVAMKNTSPEILQSRLDAIELINQDVLSIESLLARLDTLLFAEFPLDGTTEQASHARIDRLHAELESLMQGAATLLRSQ